MEMQSPVRPCALSEPFQEVLVEVSQVQMLGEEGSAMLEPGRASASVTIWRLVLHRIWQKKAVESEHEHLLEQRKLESRHLASTL